MICEKCKKRWLESDFINQVIDKNKFYNVCDECFDELKNRQKDAKIFIRRNIKKINKI
jgi:hypothetical protein